MSRELIKVAAKPRSKGIDPAQGVLDLGIYPQTEMRGFGMGVLSDGTPFLTQRGLACLLKSRMSVSSAARAQFLPIRSRSAWLCSNITPSTPARIVETPRDIILDPWPAAPCRASSTRRSVTRRIRRARRTSPELHRRVLRRAGNRLESFSFDACRPDDRRPARNLAGDQARKRMLAAL